MRSRFSLACLFATQWTEARQAPLSMRLSRQEHGSGLPYPPPGDLPNPGIEPMSQVSCIGKWVLYPLVGKTQHGCNFRQTLMKGSFSSDFPGSSEITPQSCSVLKQRACSHMSHPSMAKGHLGRCKPLDAPGPVPRNPRTGIGRGISRAGLRR